MHTEQYQYGDQEINHQNGVIINIQDDQFGDSDAKKDSIFQHYNVSQFDQDQRQDTAGQDLANFLNANIMDVVVIQNQQMDKQMEDLQKLKVVVRDNKISVPQDNEVQKIMKNKKKIAKQIQNKQKKIHRKQMAEKLDDGLNFKNDLSEKQRDKLQKLINDRMPSERLEEIILNVQEQVSGSESSSSGSFIFVKKSQLKKLRQTFLYESIKNRILQKLSSDIKERILSGNKQQ